MTPSPKYVERHEKLLQLPGKKLDTSYRIREHLLNKTRHSYWGTHPQVVNNVYDLTKSYIYDRGQTTLDPFLKALMKKSDHSKTLSKNDRNYIDFERKVSKAKVWEHLQSRADQTTTRDRNLFARGLVEGFEGYYSWTKGEYEQFLFLSKEVYAGTGIKITLVELDPKNVKRDKIMIKRHKKYLKDGPAEPRTAKQWQRPEPFKKKLFGYDAFLPGLEGMEKVSFVRKYPIDKWKEPAKTIQAPPTEDLKKLRKEIWEDTLYYYNIIFLKNDKRTTEPEKDNEELGNIIEEEIAKSPKKRNGQAVRTKIQDYIKFMFKRDWKNEQLVKVRGKKVKGLVPVQPQPKRKQEEKEQKQSPSLGVVKKYTLDDVKKRISKFGRLRLRDYGGMTRTELFKTKKNKAKAKQYGIDYQAFSDDMTEMLENIGNEGKLNEIETYFKNLNKTNSLLTYEEYAIYIGVLNSLGKSTKSKEILISLNAVKRLEEQHPLRDIERERKKGTLPIRPPLLVEFGRFKTEERRNLAKK